MNDYVVLSIWVVVVGAAFAFAWYQGYLRLLADYVVETREELKKCTWPSADELKGSTLVVMVSIILLGVFTIGIDLVISYVMRQVL